MIRIKICGIRNETDLKTAVHAGADAVGFLVGQVHVSQDFILPGTAARLAEALPPLVTPVLVTHLTAPDDVVELVERTGIHTVQLHGGSTPEQMAEIRNRLPAYAKLIFASHLREERELLQLMDYYAYADAILLDSMQPEEHRVGGTGIPCDWDLAARFVRASPVPVILAGGLSPENLADAVRTVRPYAVDANSKLKNERNELDSNRCSDFCRIAKQSDLCFESGEK